MPLGRILACLALLSMSPAHAGIVITGTRVIYPAAQKDVSVSLRNTGQAPSLVQAWVDRGGTTADPGRAADAPFLVTPPVSRVDPGKGVLLKLAYIGGALPQDRESVFWLNVLEIPSQSPKDDAGENAGDATSGSLQIAFRSQLKVFYRPASLPGSADEAARNLGWSIATGGGRTVLRASNPSPYHVSPSKLQIVSGNNRHVHGALEMVPPLGHYDIALPQDVAAWAKPGARVRYTWINDFGGPVETEAPIQ